MLWTFFSTFLSRKFEWQTSGDNSKQWGVIDSTTEIRPTVLIWDDSSSPSSGDMVETKLWYLFSYSVESTEHLIQVHLQSPKITDGWLTHKLSGIQVMFWFKAASRLISLLCHNVIYNPWSCCDTPRCQSSKILVDLMVIHKVNTSGSLQQYCSATSTHPLASRRSNTTASTFSWPSICVVKLNSLYKHLTRVKDMYKNTAWQAVPKIFSVLNENSRQITIENLTGHKAGYCSTCNQYRPTLCAEYVIA